MHRRRPCGRGGRPQRGHQPRGTGWVPGFTFTEFFVAVIVLFAVMGLAFGLMSFSGEGDAGKRSVPPYRVANAMYIQTALENMRVSFETYQDTFGALPGDDARAATVDGETVRGNANGRIERWNGEDLKVFVDLVDAGVLDSDVVRIRGRILEVFWADLLVDGRPMGRGNYFFLSGIHLDEAFQLDRTLDDGSGNAGNIVYTENDGFADLYVKLELHQ